MKQKLSIAIAGLGSRGMNAYAPIIKEYNEDAEIVAVADINSDKVKQMAEDYNIPSNRCFQSAEEMLKADKLADVMFICTQDKQHVAHAIPAILKGYDILLEKPISPDLEECKKVLEVAKRCGRKVVVCHVLRYTSYYQKIKEIIDSGLIGELVSVQGIENVGYYHQAHSFVRGNWRNSVETSPMFTQKCCHDMDLIVWMMDEKCKKVSSFGNTYLFKESKAPKGAAKRCLDGCDAKAECPYDAEKIYIHHQRIGAANGNTRWPLDVLTLKPTVESVMDSLKHGPYGRCVYYCDNDVVDHQVINLEMENGATVSFEMCGFTSDGGRYTKYMGTKGSMIANMQAQTIELWPFGEDKRTIDMGVDGEGISGYGGGDRALVKAFLDYMIEGGDETGTITSLAASMESHYMVIAAEQSRAAGGSCIELSNIR